MRKLLQILLFLLPVTAFASGASLHLDKAPINLENQESLQRGAAVFVNYCLTCHSAAAMRYSRLTDIGLTEAQIKDNLLFATDKVGHTMTIAMNKKEAKEWFGATPPDLSVITRSRGPDWLYTYLRSFYRDDTRPTGWNNRVFDKVGMPHVLQDLQGHLAPVYRTEVDHEGKEHQVIERLELVHPGKLTLAEYDALVGDLVNYMTWMGEPAKMKRLTTGVIVMIFLFVFFIAAFYLKKEYWKDVH